MRDAAELDSAVSAGGEGADADCDEIDRGGIGRVAASSTTSIERAALGAYQKKVMFLAKVSSSAAQTKDEEQQGVFSPLARVVFFFPVRIRFEAPYFMAV